MLTKIKFSLPTIINSGNVTASFFYVCFQYVKDLECGEHRKNQSHQKQVQNQHCNRERNMVILLVSLIINNKRSWQTRKPKSISKSKREACKIILQYQQKDYPLQPLTIRSHLSTTLHALKGEELPLDTLKQFSHNIFELTQTYRVRSGRNADCVAAEWEFLIGQPTATTTQRCTCIANFNKNIIIVASQSLS